MKNRLDRGTLNGCHYKYEGVCYAIQPYVYEVQVPSSARVLDWHCTTVSSSTRRRLENALMRLHEGERPLHRLVQLLRLLYLRARPYLWLSILHDAAKNKRDRVVVALGEAGFDLLMHIERDGDGQGYGVVYALPLSRVKGVVVRPPTVFPKS